LKILNRQPTKQKKSNKKTAACLAIRVSAELDAAHFAELELENQFIGYQKYADPQTGQMTEKYVEGIYGN